VNPDAVTIKPIGVGVLKCPRVGALQAISAPVAVEGSTRLVAAHDVLVAVVIADCNWVMRLSATSSESG